ncbi:MAG: hypothetical protein APR54_01040 [Candidatus Cloacimonas sp. SDB]|nr:MAG: hypothetical protein APR54_01040 [Candidatus Cloacimonas sp. SDB]
MFRKLKEKIYQKKGQKLLAAQKAEKANKYFLKCIVLNQSAENLFNLALSYMALYQYTEAEIYLRRIYEKLPQNELNALALIESLLLQRKWHSLNTILPDLKKNLPASDSIKKYNNIISDAVEREKYVNFREHIQFAFQEVDQGNTDAALEHFLKAETYFKDSFDIIQNIGIIYFQKSDYDNAYKYFEKALSLAPGNLRIQKNLIKTKKMINSQK